MSQNSDTIFAWATAPGRAGVAVLRISGEAAAAAYRRLSGKNTLPAPRMAQLATIRHPSTGDMLDKALCLWFPAPHSFTGEDVIEIHTHGSHYLMHALPAALSTLANTRWAEPGEFSRRAFANHKMDLLAAEGLADVIDAETAQQHSQALRQLHGDMGAQYEQFRTDIITILALLEAYLDFPDEDIPDHVLADVSARIDALSDAIESSTQDEAIGEKIRDGLSIVIMGPPNAGKSTLMNKLAKRDVAIVSEQAGTTRDALEVQLDIAGYAATLIDTAGLRDNTEAIEAEGIRRARVKADAADICLIMVDANTPPTHWDEYIHYTQKPHILIFNKMDTVSSAPPCPSDFRTLNLSLKSDANLGSLLAMVRDDVTDIMTRSERPIITRARHRESLQHALNHLRNAQPHIRDLELAAEDLRRAALEIAKITGRIDVDDILDVIFSSFCIGK